MTERKAPFSISSYYELVLNAHGYIHAEDLIDYVSFLELQNLAISTIELIEVDPRIGVPDGGVLSFPFEEPVLRKELELSFRYFRNELDELLQTNGIRYAEVWLQG
jgi:hypothetical protein